MPNFLNNWSLKFKSILFAVLFLNSCKQSAEVSSQENLKSTKQTTITFKVDTFSIISDNRIRLTNIYSRENYGVEECRIVSPEMIVIHYTAIPTLPETLDYFRPDSLEASRKKIIKRSPLNVGVHYVIDKDGSIYSLLPDSIMGRHLIGYNHVALGIENVAADSTELTADQLNSNAVLIKYLTDKYSSIDYLIGHQEYDNKDLPHYDLLKTEDPLYQPYKKPDPGMDFLNRLRLKLKSDYDLVLKK